MIKTMEITTENTTTEPILCSSLCAMAERGDIRDDFFLQREAEQWKENEDAITFVSTLRGNKHLILGNHDRCKDQRYRQLFTEVVDYKEIKDRVNGKEYHLVLSHFPIMFWNHQHQLRRDGDKQTVWAIQLYGHVHNSYEQTIFQDYISKLNNVYNIKCAAYNVGCMMPYMDYTPRTLAEIMSGGAS